MVDGANLKSWKKSIQRLVTSTNNIDPIFHNAQSDDIVIPVMGPTGVGKSTFISNLISSQKTAQQVQIGHNLKSCTAELQAVPFHITRGPLQGRRVVMVDTPGFNDTYVDDTEILRRIALWLSLSYHSHMKLGGIFYLYDISQKRMFGTTLNNMEMFRELCGDDALKAVFLVTTMWGDVDKKTGAAREGEVSGDFWKPMREQGSEMCRFDHTPAGAQRIFDLICDSYKKREELTTLRIQEEIVDMQKRIPDTRAGKKLRYTLQEILDQQKKNRTKDDIQKTLRQLKQLKIPFSQRFLGFFGLG